MTISTPETIHGRYRLGAPLGRGGLATTFLADDLVKGEQVALKLLSEESRALASTLRWEFLTLSHLVHPRLVPVYDFGRFGPVENQQVFYTAALVEGEPLDQFAAGREWAEVETALLDVLEALRFLHGLKLVHGDVHPSNILVDRSGRATVVDLSCSRHTGLSVDLDICGHRGFIAPELLEGGLVDGRADLFSLGATVRALAPGLRHQLPDPILGLTDRLCDPSPENRPADAAEVLEALGVDVSVLLLPHGRSGSIVGRDTELRTFTHMLEAVERGVDGSRALLLEGPDGVGRSRLLLEMKWEAQERFSVIEGSPGQPGGHSVSDMFARAVDVASGPVDGGVETLLLRVDELVQGQHGSTVIFLDDVHLLDERQRSLLLGTLRSIPSSGSLLVVCAGRDLPENVGGAVQRLKLEPLDERALRELVGDTVDAEAMPSIASATSGLPGQVVAVLDQLGSGQIGVDEVGDSIHPRPDLVEERLGGLDGDSRASLALVVLLAALRRELSTADLRELGVDDEVLTELVRGGWIGREGSSFRLASTQEAGVVRASLRSVERLKAHRRLVTWLEEKLSEAGYSEDIEAELIAHLAAAGQADAAIERFRALSKNFQGNLEILRYALGEVLRWAPHRDLLLRAAEIEERCGHPQRALRHITKLLEADPGEQWKRRGCRLKASCLLKLGSARGALDALEDLDEDGVPQDGASADLRARALIKLGKYGEAQLAAESMLARETAEGGAHVVDLLLDAGLAASYGGDASSALDALRRARAALEEDTHPHLQVRCFAYEALAAFRRGDLRAAARGFEQTLSLALDHGLDDQIAHAALNLGTAYHQMGDLGQARRSYLRALRLAVAIGAVSAEVTLRHNIATLYFDVGLTARSKNSIDRVEVLADAVGAALLKAESLSLQGRIALIEGALESALDLLSRARERFFSLDGARREIVETDLYLAALRLERDDPTGAAVMVEQSLTELRALGAKDLQARALTLAGRIAQVRGENDEAIHRLEEARELARHGQSRLVEVDALRFLGEVYDRGDAHFLARQRRIRAREILEGIASCVPSEWRDALWDRYGEGLREPGGYSAEDGAKREPRLRRLLELTTSLSSSLDPEVVLSRTMDAAIEVTGAERGFVILAHPGTTEVGSSSERQLKVAVARNIDRERLNRSSLKFSRSVAHRVIHTGEPMVTTDAMADRRFQSNRSIHAMKLRSIICVPICDSQSTIGALYVDNRFRRGRFSEEDTDLLVAFANHVAVALINARLHRELAMRTSELAERSRELESHKERIEGLLADKSERLDELQQQLSVTQEALEHRYDYSNIVGRSHGMSALLRQLDRLIPTSTTVLIRGESGTGKELCARALHYNGPRRHAPFVSINCGAIPEALLESELFGHVRGAFTDAREDKKGLLRAAQGGTLLLDEVGEMPHSMQVKLLRAIEERLVRPVGGTQDVPFDIRLLCATNRDLQEEVDQGSFRQDLYYRLAVIEVELPPLRDRPEDIPLLAEHLLRQIGSEHGERPVRLSSRALRALVTFKWPGNVRQLENVLTKATLLARGQTIHTKDLGLPRTKKPRQAVQRASEPGKTMPPDLSRESFEQREALEIAELLTAYRWNVTKTALHLGMSRTTLYSKMSRYGLSRR